ncbi:hypothetical protein FOL47_010987 [Perkinsus chesapeaki]|uniref:WRKY19-like zinc finger domain-containing protein n=1 Tax=Perkinsus chesapeaki TaxID=330153 RepID=A0A7J6MQC0_PERCH|nr:hypothetical protein FOL47_010987 [Perkinsus chesapeaki]
MAANAAAHRYCTVPNCTKYRQGGTLFCISHGGGRRCQHPGCLKSVYGTLTSRFCCAHGGGPRCQVPGCNKGSRGKKTGLCFKHGGGLAQRCRAQGCRRARLRRKLFCGEHAHLEELDAVVNSGNTATSPRTTPSMMVRSISPLSSCLSVMSRSTESSSPSRLGDRIPSLASLGGANVACSSVKALNVKDYNRTTSGQIHSIEQDITTQWQTSYYEIGLALLGDV